MNVAVKNWTWIASCLSCLIAGVATAQSPLAHPPVENPVPQYRPQAVNQPAGQGAFAEPKHQTNSAPVGHPTGLPDFFQPDKPVVAPLPTPRKLTTTSPPAKPLRQTLPNDVTPPRTKQREPLPHQPVLNQAPFRDYQSLPIDPRKPCPQCLDPQTNNRCRLTGHGGRPYQEKQYGGCQCDQRRPGKHPDFSVHWPRPFSVKLDQCDCATCRGNSTVPRAIDRLDRLADFKLIDYQRTDNGYCGPNADRFGCLGESRYGTVER